MALLKRRTRNLVLLIRSNIRIKDPDLQNCITPSYSFIPNPTHTEEEIRDDSVSVVSQAGEYRYLLGWGLRKFKSTFVAIRTEHYQTILDLP